MTHREHSPKTPSSRAGIFALLGAQLRVKGSGAPELSDGRGASKTGWRLILSVLATTLAALAFTTAPALATTGHEFKESFGEQCVVAPGESCEGKFDDPSGVAVNNATGDVYVVDKGNNRVEEFNSEGGFVAEFKGSGAGTLSEPEAIAIDNSGETAAAHPSVGDVYVADHDVVDKFQADGTYLGQITVGEGGAPLEEIAGVAVDPKGKVWVDQNNAQIDAFSDSASNTFLSSRDLEDVSKVNPGFAVDSEDNLYAGHSTIAHYISKFNSKGELLQAPDETGRTGVAVEPISNNVYIDSGNPENGAPEIQVYTPSETSPGGFIAPSGSFGPPTETFGEAQLADRGGTALAVSYANVSSGDVYVVDSSANKVDIFVPPKATGYFESFSFGGKGAGSGQFTEPLGVAVNDETEDVYVVDKGNKRVEELGKEGKFIAEFNGGGTAGALAEPEAIAVDNSCLLQTPALTGLACEAFDPSDGDVYVSDRRPQGSEESDLVPYSVDKFSKTGTYLGQLRRCPEEEAFDGSFGCHAVGHPTAGFSAGVSGVAVGPEGNVWVSPIIFGGEASEFSNAEPNTFLESSKSPASGSSALNPATGQLFVDKGSSIERYASEASYASKSSPLESFPPAGGLQESQGIAVSPVATVYATERGADNVKAFKEFPLAQVAVGAVANLRPTSVTLQGSVNPEGKKVSSCEFEYGTTTSYGQTAACEPAAGSLGEGAEPKLVGAKVSGLASGTTYHYRLVTSNAYGTNPSSDHLFVTLGPSVTAEQVTYVEATAATLNAQIDPDGGATSYRFEYDTSPYGEGEAPHGTSLPVPSASIGSGTSPVSVSVKVQGLEAGTTYYYRVVAEGAPLGAPESFYGIGKTFTTNPAKGSAESCPNEQRRAEQPYGPKLPDCRAYEMVSPLETLGNDATDSFSPAGQVRAAAEDAAITYSSYGSFAEPDGATHIGQFLSRRNEREGRWESRSIVAPVEHDTGGESPLSYYGVFFTPELTAGLTTTAAALTSAPEAAPAGLQELYLADLTSSPQSYRLVSQLPPSEEIYATPYEEIPSVYPLGASSDLTHVVFATALGETDSNGPLREWVAGRVVLVGVSNEGKVWTGATAGHPHGALDDGDVELWRAVSEDGSRVIFSYSGELYARVNVGAKAEPEPEREQSKMRDLGQPGEECLEPAKACTVKLSAGAATYWGADTDDSKIFYTENGNLYEYQLPLGAVKGKATALTHSGEVQGVTQISEDGSYVYFVAKDDLYVSHEGGTPVLIASDTPDWEGGPGADSAVLAPGAAGGARLAFTSEQNLTGYDNEEAEPQECDFENGKKCTEIYLYDAETGALVCASCNPSGARPVGPSSLATASLLGRAGSSNYRPRDLLADGSLFFDSSDALVPHAGDGRQNVYEYEGGHVYSISNVSGGQGSFFLDASADGQDVFFASADKLLPEDTGDNVAVWDAREGGGFPVEVSAPACTTAEACRAASPPTPGIYGPPPSATFSGPGNVSPPPPAVVKPKTLTRAQKLAAALKVCKKDKSKAKRKSCEASARKKYGAKTKAKAKKSATTNRRAGR